MLSFVNSIKFVTAAVFYVFIKNSLVDVVFKMAELKAEKPFFHFNVWNNYLFSSQDKFKEILKMKNLSGRKVPNYIWHYKQRIRLWKHF